MIHSRDNKYIKISTGELQQHIQYIALVLQQPVLFSRQCDSHA